MAGRHSAKNTDAPTTSAPEQWVPVEADGVPSGDGPAAYTEET